MTSAKLLKLFFRRWMKTKTLRSLLIWDIIFPGSHNSGTYDFKRLDGTQRRPPSVEAFIRCQTLTVKEQLEAGIRFLDLRVCKNLVDQNSIPYCAHGGYLTVPLCEVLLDVQLFLRENPTELIILSVRKDVSALFPPKALNVVECDFWVNLYLHEFLGSELKADSTVQSLVDRNQRVVYFYEEAERFILNERNIVCISKDTDGRNVQSDEEIQLPGSNADWINCRSYLSFNDIPESMPCSPSSYRHLRASQCLSDRIGTPAIRAPSVYSGDAMSERSVLNSVETSPCGDPISVLSAPVSENLPDADNKCLAGELAEFDGDKPCVQPSSEVYDSKLQSAQAVDGLDSVREQQDSEEVIEQAQDTYQRISSIVHNIKQPIVQLTQTVNETFNGPTDETREQQDGSPIASELDSYINAKDSERMPDRKQEYPRQSFEQTIGLMDVSFGTVYHSSTSDFQSSAVDDLTLSSEYYITRHQRVDSELYYTALRKKTNLYLNFQMDKKSDLRKHFATVNKPDALAAEINTNHNYIKQHIEQALPDAAWQDKTLHGEQAQVLLLNGGIVVRSTNEQFSGDIAELTKEMRFPKFVRIDYQDLKRYRLHGLTRAFFIVHGAVSLSNSLAFSSSFATGRTLISKSWVKTCENNSDRLIKKLIAWGKAYGQLPPRVAFEILVADAEITPPSPKISPTYDFFTFWLGQGYNALTGRALGLKPQNASVITNLLKHYVKEKHVLMVNVLNHDFVSKRVNLSVIMAQVEYQLNRSFEHTLKTSKSKSTADAVFKEFSRESFAPSPCNHSNNVSFKEPSKEEDDNKQPILSSPLCNCDTPVLASSITTNSSRSLFTSPNYAKKTDNTLDAADKIIVLREASTIAEVSDRLAESSKCDFLLSNESEHQESVQQALPGISDENLAKVEADISEVVGFVEPHGNFVNSDINQSTSQTALPTEEIDSNIRKNSTDTINESDICSKVSAEASQTIDNNITLDKSSTNELQNHGYNCAEISSEQSMKPTPSNPTDFKSSSLLIKDFAQESLTDRMHVQPGFERSLSIKTPKNDCDQQISIGSLDNVSSCEISVENVIDQKNSYHRITESDHDQINYVNTADQKEYSIDKETAAVKTDNNANNSVQEFKPDDSAVNILSKIRADKSATLDVAQDYSNISAIKDDMENDIQDSAPPQVNDYTTENVDNKNSLGRESGLSAERITQSSVFEDTSASKEANDGVAESLPNSTLDHKLNNDLDKSLITSEAMVNRIELKKIVLDAENSVSSAPSAAREPLMTETSDLPQVSQSNEDISKCDGTMLTNAISSQVSSPTEEKVSEKQSGSADLTTKVSDNLSPGSSSSSIEANDLNRSITASSLAAVSEKINSRSSSDMKSELNGSVDNQNDYNLESTVNDKKLGVSSSQNLSDKSADYNLQMSVSDFQSGRNSTGTSKIQNRLDNAELHPTISESEQTLAANDASDLSLESNQMKAELNKSSDVDIIDTRPPEYAENVQKSLSQSSVLTQQFSEDRAKADAIGSTASKSGDLIELDHNDPSITPAGPFKRLVSFLNKADEAQSGSMQDL